MSFVGEGEPMHNHESRWDEEALEIAVGLGAVIYSLNPLRHFTQRNLTFLTLFYFRLKLGINSLTIFRPKGVYSYTDYIHN